MYFAQNIEKSSQRFRRNEKLLYLLYLCQNLSFLRSTLELYSPSGSSWGCFIWDLFHPVQCGFFQTAVPKQQVRYFLMFLLKDSVEKKYFAGYFTSMTLSHLNVALTSVFVSVCQEKRQH